MIGWMNSDALHLTLEVGEAHYFSRSRQEIWRKGETSGQVQVITELRVDCDQDVLWVKVKLSGEAACHTGRRRTASTGGSRGTASNS